MDEKLEKFLKDKFREMEIQILTKLGHIESTPDIIMQLNNAMYDQMKNIQRDIKEIKMIMGGDCSDKSWADLIDSLTYMRNRLKDENK